MKLSGGYKKSLKSVEVEEIFDLIIYRPLSFFFVKIIYNTNITPNQISVVSMFLGIVAGFFYGFADYKFAVLAAALVFAGNTLDCADGQLARLKKNGTKTGRVIDGFIDYVMALSVFLGIMFYLQNYFGNLFISFIFAFTAGLSRALQNFYFDYYRNMYLAVVYNKTQDIDSEIKDFKNEKQNLKKVKGKYFDKILIDIYIFYCNLQKKFSKNTAVKSSPEQYRKINKIIIRIWSWIGSTTHITVLIIFTLLDKIELYLFLTLGLGNFLMIILLVISHFANKKLTPDN